MKKTEDDLLLEATQAVHDNYGNVSKAAEALGIARSTLRSRIAMAAQRGLVGTSLGQVSPGFLVKHISTNYDKDGTPQQEWVIQQPEALSYEQTILAVEAALEGRVPALPVIQRQLELEERTPHDFNVDDLATVYPLVDHHLGLYSWEPETGANYDLQISQDTLRNTFAQLVASSPASRRALILNVGDFFHSDDNSNRTRKSGNILDADGRYAKILEIGVDLEIFAIELALTKHEIVEVRNLPGNHDPYASLALNTAIRMAFRDNPRVHVSRDPSPFFFWRFGKVLIGSTHGDMIKASDMPGVMAAYDPQNWGETEHRYVYLGHVHHNSIGGGEKHGAVWETFRTLAAGDAWHKQSGYASGRSMVAITHHREYGEVIRNTVNIVGPGYKKR
jgi:hypothetical protein